MGQLGTPRRSRLKRGGKTIHTEAQTFDRKPAAASWLKKREGELAQPGALDRLTVDDPALADVLDQYIRESRQALGPTKEQVLRAIKGHHIASLKCSQVGSDEISAFAQELLKKVEPQTVGNYISHLSAVFAAAKPLWKYPLDRQAMKDAITALKRMGTISRSKQRDRRPTLDERDKQMKHFGAIRARRPRSTPMATLIAFAIFSTRREDEISRLAWPDLDENHSRILVRDMKNPGEKNIWCDLTPEALAVIRAQPRTSERIFPYSTDTICAAFTRACYAVGINTEEMPAKLCLHFHDLHDGVSRLFKLGWNIPHVAGVSGHRGWQSLKRYTHIRQTGDRYADWPLLAVIAAGGRR